MKTHLNRVPMIAPAVLALLLAVNSQFSTLQAQGTAFTYQGRLTDSGQCADGLYDFIFTVYNNPNPALATFNANNVNTTTAIPVTNGLFTVTNLDFGTSPFVPGQALWLQIQVRTNNTPPYGVLSPLQALTPTPYAIAAENVNGSVSASQLTGMLPSASFSGTYGNTVNLSNTGNSFTGNGAGLLNVNASTVGGLPPSDFWQLTGNAGTTPGLNFLGTTDNKALELHVNSQRAMQILVPASDSPNLIGGFNGNLVDSGLNGVVISGGGTANFLGGGSTNHVSANYSSIGGGSGNWIQPLADHSVIAGGWQNSVGNTAYESVIAGGQQNAINNSATYSFIAGGLGNSIAANFTSSAIGGGDYNQISANSAFIGGGNNNTARGDYSFAGGGVGNILSNAPYSAIAGGQSNAVVGFRSSLPPFSLESSSYIGGGQLNSISSEYSCIGGGFENSIQGNSSTIAGGYINGVQSQWSTIAGGADNSIEIGSDDSVIAGGIDNTIQSSALYASIGGGSQNEIGASSSYSSIASGGFNAILTNNSASAIAGGSANTIQASDFNAFIGGGYQNTIQGNLAHSTIGGGNLNVIQSGASFATIPGGLNNTAGGAGSFAAGEYANALSANSFVWGDGSANAYDHGPNTFSALATNGFHFVAGGGSVNIDNNGNLSAPVITITGGADVAEPFKTSSAIPKGSVVIIDDEHPGQLMLSQQPYDTRVAGIISGANGISPGISLRQQGTLDGDQNVALSGRVYVLADSSNGAIHPGDLLTTSSRPGHAMKVTDHAKAQGAILGKAMTGLNDSDGMVLVLVTLQ